MSGALSPFLHMPSQRAQGQSYLIIIIAIIITVTIIVSTFQKAPHNLAWIIMDCFGLSLGYNTSYFVPGSACIMYMSACVCVGQQGSSHPHLRWFHTKFYPGLRSFNILINNIYHVTIHHANSFRTVADSMTIHRVIKSTEKCKCLLTVMQPMPQKNGDNYNKN
jgi:hypothetical protein